MDFLRATVTHGSSAGEAFWKQEQNVTDEMMRDLQVRREDSLDQKCGETAHVARIPQMVWDEIYRMGHDPVRMWRDDPQELLKLVRIATAKMGGTGIDPDALMATKKRLV